VSRLYVAQAGSRRIWPVRREPRLPRLVVHNHTVNNHTVNNHTVNIYAATAGPPG
jgi:hypothetical protein